jgi:hypothetical protein
MSTLSEQIAAAAAKAASVSNDGVTVTQRPLTELMAYENHKAAQTATASPAAMMKAIQLQLVPPGGC